MKKIFLTFCALVILAPSLTHAENKSFFIEKGKTYKIDIVGIIVDCGAKTSTRKELKKCFALKFLEKRKELKTIRFAARELCEDTQDKLQCEREEVAKSMTSESPRETVDENTVSIPTPTATPEPSSTPTNTKVTTNDGKWRTSSHWSAEFYYCPESDSWTGLSESYLDVFDTEEELLAEYNGQRELHPDCQ